MEKLKRFVFFIKIFNFLNGLFQKASISPSEEDVLFFSKSKTSCISKVKDPCPLKYSEYLLDIEISLTSWNQKFVP